MKTFYLAKNAQGYYRPVFFNQQTGVCVKTNCNDCNPHSFDTELTLLFSGGSTFLKIESRNVFVYFIVAPPMGDNYIDTFRTEDLYDFK